MKKLLLSITALALSFVAWSQQPSNLKFREDKTLTILQMTDLHLVPTRGELCQEVFDRMDFLYNTEKPDVIVITGDLIFGKPGKPMLEAVVKRLDGYKVPWCIVFGNHDAEQEMSRAEMSQIICSGKYSLNRLNGKGELADMEIPAVSSDGKEKKFYLFCMDSNDYSKVSGVSGYGWFSQEQINWLRDCCKARTPENGKAAPAIAFFHIPLNEYVDAWAVQENSRYRMADRKHGTGIRGENIAAGAINSGMFAAMVESGSVIGTFAGHDHDSDFVATYQGLTLGYGCFSGCDNVYNNLHRGGRLIRVKEDSRSLETWVRTDDGRVRWHVRSNGKELEYAPGSSPFGQWTEFKD